MGITFNKAVKTLLQDPANRDGMINSYLDCNPSEGCKRFIVSEEFQDLLSLIKKYAPLSNALADIGCGNGFTSLAFAESGYTVTAIEPDPCEEFGFGAFKNFPKINAVQASIESLPFPDRNFDVVYTRQVLHHIKNLDLAYKEIARILKPQGIWIATREHVVSNEQELKEFLAGHPIHKFCQNEHAYTLREYTKPASPHFIILKNYGPFDSVINHYPISNKELQSWFENSLLRKFPKTLVGLFAKNSLLLKYYRKRLSAKCKTPGRMHTFIMKKAL